MRTELKYPCSVCKLEKPSREFWTRKNGKPESWCKECRKQKSRKREQNSNHILNRKSAPSWWKPNTEQLIVQYYYTKTLEELKQITGIDRINRMDIKWVVQKHDLDDKKKTNGPNIENKTEAVKDLIEKGYANKDIIRLLDLDCDSAALSYWRKKWGLNKSTRYFKIDPEVGNSIQQLYLNQVSIVDISKQYQIDTSTVLGYLYTKGIVTTRNVVIDRPGEGPVWTNKLKGFIRQRDGQKCALCDKNNQDHKNEIGKNLAIHHIVPYQKTQNHNIWNLITLCCRCHKLSEMKYTEELIQRFQTIPNEQLINTFITLFR